MSIIRHSRAAVMIVLFLQNVCVAQEPQRMPTPPAASVQLPAKNKFHLFLLMGQSNMAIGVKLDAADMAVADRILVLDPKDGASWLPVLDKDKKPVPLGVGPGLGFAAEYARQNPGVTVGLVPTAVGGSPLASWEKNAALYDQALARLAKVRERGVLKAVLWHQGETDAYKTSNPNTYGARLAQMIGDLRADVKEPRLPFIVGEIGQFVARKSSFTFVGIINQHLQAIPSQVKRTACVSASGLTDGGDSLHFSEAASHEQGRRYEKAYQQIIAADERSGVTR